MRTLQRGLALVLSAALAAAPLCAAELDTAPLAGPQWMRAFAAADIAGTPSDCGTLAAALVAQGVTPERLALAGTNAQTLVDSASVAFVRNLIPASPNRLDNGRLALGHARVSAAKAGLARFLSPSAAVSIENDARSLFQEARRRELVDSEGRLTRTAAALSLATADLEDAGFPSAPLKSPPPKLARAERPAETPRRPSPRAPVFREYSKPNALGRAARIAAFSGALVGLFAGRAPVVFADMDETVAPTQVQASPEMIKAVAQILRAGGSYGILTGSSIEMVKKNVVDPLRRELGGDEKVLDRLAIAARSGAQIYRFDRKAGDFKLKRVGALDGFLLSKGVRDGSAKIRAVLEETAREFDFAGRMRRAVGKEIQGDLIVEDRVDGTDVLTQFVLVPTGKGASKEDKRIYDAADGRAERERYAAYINTRLRGLGVPVEARVAGKTSIDVGVDKSLGFQALAEEFKVHPKNVLWAGDSHGEYGNDAPAAKLAGLVLNVGPRVAGFGVPSFQEHDGGPDATLAYYRIIGLYARVSAWWRSHLRRR